MAGNVVFPAVSLSVVMPAYNEEANIVGTIVRAVESLRKTVGEFEILIIDDGSRDRTAELAEDLAKRFPEVRALRNEHNLGQGGTLRRGFGLARLDLVTHNAMDYPFDFDDLPQILRHFPEAAVVVATRRSYPGVSVIRKIISFGHRTLTFVLFGSRISDHNFIQVYKRETIQAHPGFSTATAFFAAEKILRAQHDGLKVVEEQMTYHARLEGESSSGNWKNIRNTMVDMTRLWLELKLGR